MSEENVEIVRRVFEGLLEGWDRGYFGGGFDTGLVAEDFEFVLEPEIGFVEGKVWHGREGYVELNRLVSEQIQDWYLRVERLIDADDDRVVVLLHQWGTGRESGAPVEMELGQVWELEDGRLVRATTYTSHAKALEAAGLSE